MSTTLGNDLLRELNGSEWRTLHIDPRDLNALGLLGEALSTMVIYDLRSDPQEVEDFAISAKRNPLTRSHNPIFVGADDEQRSILTIYDKSESETIDWDVIKPLLDSLEDCFTFAPQMQPVWRSTLESHP